MDLTQWLGIVVAIVGVLIVAASAVVPNLLELP